MNNQTELFQSNEQEFILAHPTDRRPEMQHKHTGRKEVLSTGVAWICDGCKRFVKPVKSIKEEANFEALNNNNFHSENDKKRY